ncbi:MAG: pilus assembly PilX N-terminal domain-containing protein [Actinomycetes bacterium]
MNLIPRLRQRLHDDSERGMAMIVTLMVIVMLTAISTTVVVMSVQNTKNADRDRQGQGALDIADAGVAAADEYLRTASLATITCPESSVTGTFTSTDANCIGGSVSQWSNPVSPKTVVVNGQSFKVFISYVSKASPPAQKFGIYRVHSTGIGNSTPAGQRVVTTDVTVKPFQFPIGVYADTISDVGSSAVITESVFTSGCVTKRSHMSFSGTSDPYYGLYPGVHSATGITEANNGCTTSNDTIKGQPNNCNASYPGDQDPYGGATGGSVCASTGRQTTTYFDLATLQSTYGAQTRGLTQSQYAALKALAVSEGQYYTSTTFTAPDPATYPNAVMYFKLNPGDTLKINNELNAYDFANCGQRSLTIIVEGGDVEMQAQADLVGALFVPDGTLAARGGAQMEGTLYAKQMDKFNGNATFRLDNCWLSNMPGPLMDLSTGNFRQVDR